MTPAEAVADDVKDAWDRVAEGFDAHVTPTNMAIAEKALRRAGLRQGARLLDVAAGSGALSIPAARQGAEVLAADISPTMVERLNARAREAGLNNLEARVMDGHALELEDDTFDLVASQFGVMLFPDMPQGLREMARVAKPGGRVLTVVMGNVPEVGFLTTFVGALKAADPGFEPFPGDGPPLPMQLADPGTHQQALEAAGLRDVRVESANHALEFGSAKEMWTWLTSSNPIAVAMVAGLTAEQRATALKALDGALQERAGGAGPAVIDNRVYIGVGTK